MVAAGIRYISKLRIYAPKILHPRYLVLPSMHAKSSILATSFYPSLASTQMVRLRMSTPFTVCGHRSGTSRTYLQHKSGTRRAPCKCDNISCVGSRSMPRCSPYQTAPGRLYSDRLLISQNCPKFVKMQIYMDKFVKNLKKCPKFVKICQKVYKQVALLMPARPD